MTGAASRAVEVWSSYDADRGGYVLDNMEGAVDRAAFLAKTDMPVAIIGARGTGKMYVARVVHQESGGAADGLMAVDCRQFRNRDVANRRIDSVLRKCHGKTVVFKYPHLMCCDAQLRLARQLTTRILADSQPPSSLPRAKFVALFPEQIEHLVHKQQLTQRLGSVFAGYPIFVPPIRDRRRAVLRWADKILLQECGDRGMAPPQFTPEAEQAMLAHRWDGNISEIRQRIVGALENTRSEWLGPADLGLYEAPTARGPSVVQPLVDGFGGERCSTRDYSPDVVKEFEQKIAEVVHHVLGAGVEEPLGTWLEDEVTLAVLRRCASQPARAAKHLQTTSRNIQRWLPRIESRGKQRAESVYWRLVGDVVHRWVDELEPGCCDPLGTARQVILRQLETQGANVSVKHRACILGVSVPTYSKRVKQLQWPDREKTA